MLTLLTIVAIGQTNTQVVTGKVIDHTTREPLMGATIVIVDSDPMIGAVTDETGTFKLAKVPVGRHSFEIGILGYQNYLHADILVSSGKEVLLNTELKEMKVELSEVVVQASQDRSEIRNVMASVSSRQFSVEQSERFAGGMDDPSRLVTAFAGVANPSISSNGISVRGNSPSGLIWRLEGVEIPVPNHFNNLTIAGAGLMTALSNHVVDNSDFYTGAFPSEFGNVTSGVFDIRLRNGNHNRREHTVKAGLLGVEFATEGPFKSGNDASYLLNYRYSTLALMGAFLPNDAGIPQYQDLSFKMNFPTRAHGTFSFWGLGALDGIDTEAEDIADWEVAADSDNSQTSQYLFASGIQHKIFLNDKSVLHSSISLSGDGLKFDEQRLDQELIAHPQSSANKSNYKIAFQTALTSYLSEKHTNRTGLYYTHMGYDLEVKQATELGGVPIDLVAGQGQSDLIQLYSSSNVQISNTLELTSGIHTLYFLLNNEWSVEPRLALTYHLNDRQRLSMAYGLHSRIESLPVYFVSSEENISNKNLDLMKSNHFVLSYENLLSKHLKLTVEPYVQYLTNVPVSPHSYISTINIQNSLFFDEALISEGVARNVGLDLMLERFLHNGTYYSFSVSAFDSKYTSADGVQRNTRFNKNYIVNALVGKEWQVGKNKNNIFSANVRLNYMGGNRIEAIDLTRSAMVQDVVFGERNGQLSFDDRFPDLPIFSFTVSYRKNKLNHSSVWALQVLNAAQAEDFQSHIYNLQTESIETRFSKIMIPNLSYKIEF